MVIVSSVVVLVVQLVLSGTIRTALLLATATCGSTEVPVSARFG